MLREKIIRAWKDPDFRTSLSNEDLAELPESPAGAIELTDDELEMAAGGSWGNSSNSASARPSSSRPSSNSASSRPSSSAPSASNSSSNSASNSSSNSSSNSASNSSSNSSMSSRPRIQPYTTRGPSYSSSGHGWAKWK